MKSHEFTLIDEQRETCFSYPRGFSDQDKLEYFLRDGIKIGVDKILGNRYLRIEDVLKNQTKQVGRSFITRDITELDEIRVMEDVFSVAQDLRFKPVFQKLEEFLDLPDNWDSYDSLRINPECVIAAKQLIKAIMLEPSLKLPFPVPLNNGYIQLEWHKLNMDLEIEFISLNEIEIYYYDTENEIEWTENITTLDIDKLTKLVRNFS
jgi:hypothetical protein